MCEGPWLQIYEALLRSAFALFTSKNVMNTDQGNWDQMGVRPSDSVSGQLSTGAKIILGFGACCRTDQLRFLQEEQLRLDSTIIT